MDCGRYAVKRCAGDTLTVSADIFRDGHDLLRAAARLRRRARGKAKAGGWREVPLQPVEGRGELVRFTGEIELDAAGDWEYELRAWVDRLGTWQQELARKLDAGQQDLAGELAEGRLLLETIRQRARRDEDSAAVEAIDAALVEGAEANSEPVVGREGLTRLQVSPFFEQPAGLGSAQPSLEAAGASDG